MKMSCDCDVSAPVFLHEQSQLTGASKAEFAKWQRLLRIALNQLRCLGTDSGDKTRCCMGNPIHPENFGKPRGKVTLEMLTNEMSWVLLIGQHFESPSWFSEIIRKDRVTGYPY